MKENIKSILAGSVCMFIAMLTLNILTDSAFSPLVSVFVGGIVAGWLAEKKNWLPGLLVGLVNVIYVLINFVWLSPWEELSARNLSAFDLLSRPIFIVIICGFIGGLTGGLFKKKWKLN